MTVVQLRTTPIERDRGADLLLDWFSNDRAASTINCSPDFLSGLVVPTVARELFALAAAVYCADKLVPRADQPDNWTRDLEFVFAVDDPDTWARAHRALEAMLTFLSGDRVTLTVARRTKAQRATASGDQTELIDADGVCLFSGGLDSLAGAIDLLTTGQRLVLIGHHDSALAENRQEFLAPKLATQFGADMVRRRALYLRPATPNDEQARRLPAGQQENTTRTRSFLFLAAAVAVASAVGPGTPVHMPENGFIGINVPLTPARAGSLSTRTTHPLYVHYFGRVLAALGLDQPINNAFRLQTKGELVAACADRDLLEQLARETISCSHPEAARWHKGQIGNCGSCYPCLIRRAAMHRVGWDRPRDYDVDALTDTTLLRRDRVSGASLRAVLDTLRRDARPTDVLMNGRIPGGEAPSFHGVWVRGRDELRAWLDAGAIAEIRQRYA